jgi:hypothetical protein
MMMVEVPISRPSPPRPADYVVVPGSQGPRRDFRISVGLREGWDAEGRVFDVSEAVRTARAWMKRRVESGQPALSGMFTRAEVTYAWPRDDGTVGSDREPVALFTGEAVHAYLGHLSDAAIEAMLNELATELGAALGQERIYVAFADRTWILDAGEHGSDTWPGVLATTLRSERTSGLGVPRHRNLDSMRTYCSAGATS